MGQTPMLLNRFRPDPVKISSMALYKLTLKFFAANDTFAPAEFVPVFHRWIQTQSLPDHTLIDVADYAHVPAGPGTLVVASQANIHMDRGDNRLGLLYVRKQPVPAAKGFPDTLATLFKYALTAAIKMENEEVLQGRLKFRTDEIAIGFNDRLLAPNTPETIAEYHPQVMELAGKLFPGQTVSVDPSSHSPKELIDLRIKSAGTVALVDLMEQLSK
jgi:hypothetical protein